MNQIIICFLFAAIIIVGALMLFMIGRKKGAKPLDVEYFRTKCLEIEHQLIREESSSYSLTIMNADKLVDFALKKRGIKGKTMGERMKNAASLFSDRDSIWTAHKLRNQIAHESDVRVTYDQTRVALRSFRKALKDLGAI